MKRFWQWLLNGVAIASLLLCVAIAALWARSYWNESFVEMRWHGQTCRIGIKSDELFIDNSPQVRWAAMEKRKEAWLANAFAAGPPYKEVQSYDLIAMRPVAIPAPWHHSSLSALLGIILLTATAPLVRLRLLMRNRPQAGACPACSYNLTGNVSGVCPECGTPIKPRPVD